MFGHTIVRCDNNYIVVEVLTYYIYRVSAGIVWHIPYVYSTVQCNTVCVNLSVNYRTRTIRMYYHSVAKEFNEGTSQFSQITWVKSFSAIIL